MKGKDPKAVDKDAFNIESRDFTYGAINNIWTVNDKLLISYNPGLSDDEYDHAIQGITGFQEILRVTGQKNKSILAVLDLDGHLVEIEVPEYFGGLEFIDKEGNLWFSPNRSEVERDYEVLFKTKLM
ncbi:hypothetical protein [Aquiflexum sp.]|uniref:hypothetical protein n=1 Tax=Aquiflexum sp. TaxID=1872584 RepID=UPI0035932778